LQLAVKSRPTVCPLDHATELGGQFALGVGEPGRAFVFRDERASALEDGDNDPGVPVRALDEDDRLDRRVAASVRWAGVASGEGS
jgi:hypothetical protein